MCDLSLIDITANTHMLNKLINLIVRIRIRLYPMAGQVLEVSKALFALVDIMCCSKSWITAEQRHRQCFSR